ncbi:hypothetical protein TRFO_31348 [Tritrichomonas foetus]|uniref:Uncharacterized protein n=1 Tax=Tritrichomonas foetus TaxID=1144522 RepID=A0A1J4JRG1_9EUKA|nr:hypothetical protein TRFO_31348 [Tritrichomonas foetus]|eukprot:OHT01735.1 hypothetical protein TRFO_31348 [Tritrichomonas foetus]
MFFFLLSLIFSETHADVQEIILGSWTVTAKHFSGKEEFPNEESFNFISRRTDTRSIITAQLFKTDVSDTVFNATLTFDSKSKGKFILTEYQSNHFIKTIANFDFSPILPPHISSVGDWGDDKTFNSILITNQIAQLTLFDKNSLNWTVFQFDKVGDAPKSFIDKYFSWIFLFVTFILIKVVVDIVRRIKTWKVRKEAEKILQEQEKQRRMKNGKKKGKKNH